MAAVAKRFVELGVAPRLAVELTTQINSGVGNKRRLIELGIPPIAAGLIVAGIGSGTLNRGKIAEAGIIPRVAKEIMASLGGPSVQRTATITSATALTDYQVKVPVAFQSGMRSDFGDVRFFASNGTTALPYYLDSATSGVAATFFVRVPVVANGATAIVMQYGGGLTTTTSNGFTTFPFFDDFATGAFDTAKWTVVSDPVGAGTSSSIQSATAIQMIKVASGDQGFLRDANYYYVGLNNGAGVNGSILKYDLTGTLVATLVGPPHSARGCFRDDTGNMIWCTGTPDAPAMWEIDTAGTKIREWAIADIGLANAPGVVYRSAVTGGFKAWVFTETASGSYPFTVSDVTFFNDGTKTVAKTWSHPGVNYQFQGCALLNGALYYLTSEPTLTADPPTPGRLYALTLGSDTSITPVPVSLKLPEYEVEGMCAYGGTLWYLDKRSIIFRLDIETKPVASFYTNPNSSRAAYLKSIITQTPPIVIGARSKLSLKALGIFLGLMDDLTGQPPNRGANSVTAGVLNSSFQTLLRTYSSTTGTDSAALAPADVTVWHNYEISHSGTAVDLKQDGTSLGTKATNIPTAAMSVVLGANTGSVASTATVHTDHVYLRKFAASEPTVAIA